ITFRVFQVAKNTGPRRTGYHAEGQFVVADPVFAEHTFFCDIRPSYCLIVGMGKVVFERRFAACQFGHLFRVGSTTGNDRIFVIIKPVGIHSEFIV
ncbi:MAG: hypothetical protein CUN57_01775, partial [Phototrophicales bacterium]